MTGRAQGRREILLAGLFFLAATLLFTYPIGARASEAMADLWDAKLTAWITHWDYHQFFQDPLHLFDANIFHPARLALAFSENLFGVALFGFPLYAAGFSTLMASNVLFLLGMFLSALAAWAFAREVTGDAAASLLAGIVYAFLPWRISQIPHLQFQWGAFLPLLLLFLIRYLEGGRRRDLALFAICFAWNGLANVHYGIFAGALAAVLFVFEAISRRTESRGRIGKLLLATGAAGLVLLPFYLPYAKAASQYGLQRSFSEMRYYSGSLKDFLSAGSRNWLYGSVTSRFAHPEGDFFPGLVPLALGIYAVLRLRRTAGSAVPEGRRSGVARRDVRVLDGLTVSLLLLAAVALLRPGLRLGPVGLGDPGRVLLLAAGVFLLRLVLAFPRRSRSENLGDWIRRSRLDRRAWLLVVAAATGFVFALGVHTPVFRFLHQSLGPLFRAIRAPSRAIVLFDVGLAVFAAWGLSRLAGRGRSLRRAGLLTGALLLTGLEYRAFPIKVFPVDAAPSPVYRWLAGVPVAAVMEWPLGDVYDFEYEFRSTSHWKPLVNGSSGFGPPHYRELRDLLSRNPIPDEIWRVVSRLGPGLLVFHPHDAPPRVLSSYAKAVDRAVRLGELEVWKTFPHGADTDYVFRITSAPGFDAGVTLEDRRRAAVSLAELSLRPGLDPSPPFGALDFPPEDFEVQSQRWAIGWALDDSSIQEVRVSTEVGSAGAAAYGGPRPDVGGAFPNAAGSARSGFVFPIPKLPPGPHTLTVTIVAKDGGSTVITRPIRVR